MTVGKPERYGAASRDFAFDFRLQACESRGSVQQPLLHARFGKWDKNFSIMLKGKIKLVLITV